MRKRRSARASHLRKTWRRVTVLRRSRRDRIHRAVRFPGGGGSRRGWNGSNQRKLGIIKISFVYEIIKNCNIIEIWEICEIIEIRAEINFGRKHGQMPKLEFCFDFNRYG